MDVNEGIQFGDMLGLLRRRRGIILWIAGTVFLTSIFVAAVLPNEYESYATLLIEPQTISESLVQSSQQGTDLSNRLNLMAMQILSRSRLSRVIDELKLYPELSEEITREEVIEEMRDFINVVPIIPELVIGDERDLEINTFQILFRDRDAGTAAAVTNRLANDFVEEHIRARTQTSGDTSEFLQSELGRLAARIAEVEERVGTVKAENVGSLPDDMLTNQRLAEASYDQIRAAERRLSEARSDQAFYKQQVLSAASLLDPRDQISPERRLELLEVQLAEMRSRGFTDKHPDVVSTKAELADVLQRLGMIGDEEAEEERPKSLAQQNAEAEAHRAALRADASLEELKRLRAQVEAIVGRIASTPRVAERLDGLEREYRHLYESYQQFSAKRLEAAVAADMERQVKGERFRVLESAVPPPEASSPNRPLIMLVGLLVGLALGGGVGVLLEATDRSFHGAAELQASLRIPVLASVPSILLQQDRHALRRRRLRTAIFAGVMTGFFLVSSGVGYVWVNGVPAPLKGLTGSEVIDPGGEQG